MRLSSIIIQLEDYFLNKQFSYKHKEILTPFIIDLLDTRESFLNFFSLKKRKEKKVFAEKIKNFHFVEPKCYKKEGQKEDPTIDQYISDHGGIKSHLDNKVYTTKASYLESIKARGHHINE